MPDAEMTKAMMEGYQRTASKFLDSEDELKRFLGTTGLMLSKAVSQLWTQEQLEKQIDERLSKRCEVCPNTAYINLLKDGRVVSPEVIEEKCDEKKVEQFSVSVFVMTYGRSIIWAVAFTVTIIGITGNLKDLGDFVDRFKSEKTISAYSGPEK